jgi:hypothetical protein
VTTILFDEETVIPTSLIPATDRQHAVISASLDGEIHIWNLVNCKLYKKGSIGEPIFKLKLLPRNQLLTLEQVVAQPGSEQQLDLLIVTARSQPLHQIEDDGVSAGKEKVKIGFEVNSFELESLAKNDDLPTISSHHAQMDFLTFNAAANNKHGIYRPITAIIYVKNK